MHSIPVHILVPQQDTLPHDHTFEGVGPAVGKLGPNPDQLG
jgi:hypothetical protein